MNKLENNPVSPPAFLPSLGISGWKKEALPSLAAKILEASKRPLVLVDGKGGCGKTSFAVKLAKALDAGIVSTDDVARHADPIHWDGELMDGIIRPWLEGGDISYKPSGWVKKDREGCIKVDSAKALIIEGSGACRRALRKVADFSVWIDTEPEISRARVIERDLAAGENGATLESVTEFTDWWDSVLDPFLLEEAAWKHVNIIVSGFSDLSSDVLLVHSAFNPQK